MSKKLLALLLAMIMIVGSFTSVFAAETTTPADDKKAEEKVEEKTEEKAEEKTEEKEEMKEEEPVKEEVKDEHLAKAIEVLKKAGVITGYSADSDDFKVEKNVKRSEFATMIVKAMGLDASAKALATIPTGFKDVPTNHWANGYIAVAKQQGFVNGYTDGTFRPDRQISYQDMATMLTIALGQAEVGTVYPAGYVVKAQQLGLFNKVDVPAYTDMATRGNVFKMLYNMMTSKEFGQRKIVKAIVLENSRVEKMADDEIVVEVIKVVQEANWVEGSRTKRGDQHKYKLDKDLKLDAEDLLGKVIDLTVNKDDEIVDVTVDKTYDYVEGNIDRVDAKKFKLAGKVYSALFDERYDNDDERIYRTYLNRKDKKYIDFARNYEREKYNFARATIKNGKVVFIDAYKFDDIAPVSNAKDGDVYYLDDAWKANEVKASKLNSRVIFHDKAGYSVGDIKNIAKDDVIHFYNGYTDAIVRKDAKVEGKLDKTVTRYEGNAIDYVVLGEDEYELSGAVPFQAIYSFEGKKYFVVTGGDRKLLDDIVGDNVKVLVALDGTAQLIEGTKEWSDGIQAIKKITGKAEVKFLPSAGEEFWAEEGRDTDYYVANRFDVSNNARLHNFIEDDIVYLERGEKGEIAVMGNILPKSEYSAFNKEAGINGRYIWYRDKNGNMMYKRHFSNLHAYGYGKHGLYQIKDLGEFIKKNAKNTDLEAYVLTETELRDRLWDNFEKKSYNFLSSEANDVASIVVFKGAVNPQDSEPLYAEIVRIWNDSVEYIDADKNMFSTNGKELPAGAVIGDIVELNVVKSTLKESVKKIDGKAKFAIRLADPIYEIRESITKPQTYEIFRDGEWKEVKWDADQVVFNPREYKYVQYRTVKDAKSGEEFMDVMRYLDSRMAGRPQSAIKPTASYSNGLVLEVTDAEGRKSLVNIERFTKFISIDGSLFGVGPVSTEPFVTNNSSRNIKIMRNNLGEVAEIRALKNSADSALDKANEYLAKAKAIIARLEARYPNGTTDQAQKLMDAIKAELTKEGLTGKVNVTRVETTTPADAKGNGVMTVTLESTPAPKTTTTKAFHIETADETEASKKADAQAAVNELAKRLNGKTVPTTATPAAADGKYADTDTQVITDIKTALDGLNSTNVIKDLDVTKVTPSIKYADKVADGINYTITLTFEYETGKTVTAESKLVRIEK